MSDKKDKWANEWKQGQGVSQDNAEKAQSGVNKPASEVLGESWQNLKDAFTPGARGNTVRENKKRDSGGYPGR